MNQSHLSLFRFTTQLIFLFSLLGLSSCCTQRLSRAQDDFNNFEEKYKEIQLELSDRESIPYQGFFEDAYEDVQSALGKKSCLEQDYLLADAYLIKALCEFRLDIYDKSRNSANKAITEYFDMESKGLSFQVERKKLAQILLIQLDIEQSGKELKTFYSSGNKNYDQAKSYHLSSIYAQSATDQAKLEEAISEMEDFKSSVEGNNPLMIALISSQLAGLKIWSDGISKFWESKGDGATMTKQQLNDYIQEEEEKHLLPRKKELLEELEGLLTPDQAEKWVKWWDDRI